MVLVGGSGCTQRLLELGATIDATDKARNTALHLAARDGKEAIIWLLAGHGADLDFPDGSGRTALHLAVYNGQVEAAEALIVLGANTRITNRKGKTPLEGARMGCRYLKPQ